MVNSDSIEAFRKNWTGSCRECEWEHANIGSQAVIVEARIHLNSEGDEHVTDVYRDGDLMTVVDSVIGSESEYLGENTPPLQEREQEREKIAREVADPEDAPDQ